MRCSAALPCTQPLGNSESNLPLFIYNSSWNPSRESFEEMEPSVEELDCNLEPADGINQHTISKTSRGRQRMFSFILHEHDNRTCMKSETLTTASTMSI